MRRGGGIGLLVLVIAAAIVMILTMRAWLAVAPTAQQIMNPGLGGELAADRGGGKGAPAKGRKRASGAPGSIPDHGQPQAADQAQKGLLPDLKDMKDGTDQHAKAVDDALKETNK